jgi:hypothetical protein
MLLDGSMVSQLLVSLATGTHDKIETWVPRTAMTDDADEKGRRGGIDLLYPARVKSGLVHVS